MNKKLLALAVGAALGAAPMFANADVKLYGQLQAEIAEEDSDLDRGFADNHVLQNTGNLTHDGTSVEDNKRGRLGVKASEKLGNGLTAIAKFEWQVSTVKADVDDGDRESWVGLKGGFGQLHIGSVKSPYKYYGGVKYDPFVTTNLEARRYGGMSSGRFGHNSFFTDSVGYYGKFGGVTVGAAYSPDEVDGSDGDYSLGAKFGTGPFEVIGAVVSDDSSDYDAWKIGGKAKFGNITVLGQYEDLDNDGEDGDMFFLGGHFKFGNNLFVAQYGEGDTDIAGGGDLETEYFALGLIHKFSKKTRLFGGYAQTDTDDAGDRDVITIGMRMDF